MDDLEIRLALAESAIGEMKHRARNDRQVATLLESELDHARREIVSLKAKLYTGIGAALVAGPLFAWMIDLIR